MPNPHKLSDISFHTGLLIEEQPERWYSEGFHRMVVNMEMGGILDGGLGYGMIGTGVYHTTDIDDLVLEPKDHPVAYVIDCSPEKYNCFKPGDADKALWFLSDLQTFVIQRAVCPEGWEKLLPGATKDTLYQEYTDAFKDYEILDYQNFANEIEELITYTQTGFTDKIDQAGYPAVKENMKHADNIATKFLKHQGFGGVDFRGSEHDNVEHGSVVFEFDEQDIIAAYDDLTQLYNFETRFFNMSEIANDLAKIGFIEDGIIDDKTLRVQPQHPFSDCNYYVDLSVTEDSARIKTVWIDGQSYDFEKESNYLKNKRDRLYKTLNNINKVLAKQKVISIEKQIGKMR